MGDPVQIVLVGKIIPEPDPGTGCLEKSSLSIGGTPLSSASRLVRVLVICGENGTSGEQRLIVSVCWEGPILVRRTIIVMMRRSGWWVHVQ